MSLLPMPVLYLFSDFAYFIVYYVLGYRKEIVLQNLSIAFPDKSEEEKNKIAKGFYKNFCDTFIETIKFITADRAYFAKRFTADYSALEAVYETGRSIQFQLGHNFNWELANLAVPLHLKYKVLGVYLPLGSKLFDRLFQYIRSRFGTQLIAATNMKNEMIAHRNSRYIIGLIADQAPPIPEKAGWVKFFGRPTAFLKGPEKAAKNYNYPVVFCHFTKTKRGHYCGHVFVATLHPQALADGELTKMYASYLESTMSQNPEMWLWSHRRWKHQWKPEFGEIIS